MLRVVLAHVQLLLSFPFLRVGADPARRPACSFLVSWRRPIRNTEAPVRLSILSAGTFSWEPEGPSLGRVIRLGAREYHPEHSKPSSRKYTTRKPEQDILTVSLVGAHLDYNHYRTVALDGTKDRAISILTTDTMDLLRSYGYPVEDGDLGENILVSGVPFSFFEPGKQYAFLPDHKGSSTDANLVLEITEAMTPCANLCKLSYICDATKSPKAQVETCRHFLAILDKATGLRGWYAKVIVEGEVEQNFQVILSEAVEASNIESQKH